MACLVLVLAAALPPAGRGQTQLPGLRQAATVRVSRATVSLDPRGTVVPRPDQVVSVGSRLATTAELAAVLAVDSDQDGIENLLDSMAANPYCGSPDGSYADLADADGDGRPACLDVDDADPSRFLTGDPDRDAMPSTDGFTAIFRAFPDAGALVEHYLAANRDEGSPYPAAALIAVADQAGFPSETLDRWTRTFACGKDLRRECERACRARFAGPHADGRELARCIQDCKEIPDCPKARPPKPPHPPRGKPPGRPRHDAQGCCGGGRGHGEGHGPDAGPREGDDSGEGDRR